MSVTTPCRRRSISRGTWRAAVADGDLAQRFADPAISTTATGPRCRFRATGARRRAFAATRRAAALPPPLRGAAARRRAGARSSSFDGIFYYGDVWLDGDYLGATEGYFFPHTFEVTDSARAPDDEHVARGRGRVPAPARPHREADDHRRVPALGQPRPGLEPGRDLAAGPPRDTGPGAHRAAARACAARRPRSAAGCVLDVTLDAGPDPRHRRRSARGSPRRVTGPGRQRLLAEVTRDVTLAAGDNHLQLDRRRRPTHPGGGRGGSATSRSATSRSSVEVDGEPQRRPPAAHRVPRGALAATGSCTVNGERCS